MKKRRVINFIIVIISIFTLNSCGVSEGDITWAQNTMGNFSLNDKYQIIEGNRDNFKIKVSENDRARIINKIRSSEGYTILNSKPNCLKKVEAEMKANGFKDSFDFNYKINNKYYSEIVGISVGKKDVSVVQIFLSIDEESNEVEYAIEVGSQKINRSLIDHLLNK